MFCATFTYHIIFDENLTILQCGNVLADMIGVKRHAHLSMAQVFKVVYPRMTLTLENILSFINSVFVIALRVRDDETLPTSAQKGILALFLLLLCSKIKLYRI